MYVDCKTQLPEEFLMMTDRFSMAHSLEARTPFLDRALVEMALTIPSRLRSRPDDPKGLLRKSMLGVLPSAVSQGSKKGFVLPTGPWLRGRLRGLVDKLLSRNYLREQGIFRPDYHDRFVRPHLEGKAERGERIWPMLMFQLWHIVFIKEHCRARPSFTWQDLC